MVCLSAHSLCAPALSTSRAGTVWSFAEGGRSFCAVRDGKFGRRVRQLHLECLRETKLGYTGGCARKERSNVHCIRAASAAAAAAAEEEEEKELRCSAKDLEARFGQAGVKFLEAAGYQIVEMRLKEGSSARIVLQTALVASYKSRMWHGGVEELLYTTVVPGVEESQRPTTVGGVAVRVCEVGTESESNLAATECWNVENVRSNPSQFVQIMLSTTSKNLVAGALLQFKYVFTLTEASLSCALITTNIGNQPVSVYGSLQTNVAVNFVDGAYALGLQGCKYRPSPPNSTPEPVPTGDEMVVEKEEMVVEKEEMVGMTGGIDRLYTEIQDSMSLLDRGKRRTVKFYHTGFEDVRLSNPGEESGLEDWDSFVCVELARLRRPVHLQPGQEWRAAKQLVNPSK